MRPGGVGLFLTLALWLSAPCAEAQTTGRAILIANSGEATLSVLDIATRTERARIPVLREPHHFALTPDGRDLLLGDTAANELLFLDPHSFAIRRRMTMADPYQLGFSPNGKLLVVTGLARDQIDIYDAASYQLVKRFAVKSMPSHMDFAPDGSAVYVTLQKTSKVVAIDLSRMSVLWTHDVGKTPAGAMFVRGKLLVACMDTDFIVVLNPATGATERTVRTGRGAHQLFRSPDGKIVYVNNRVDSTVVALDAATLAVQRSYKVPGGPDDLVFTPDGMIWTTLRFSAKVGILDPRSGAVQTIAVGRSPHGITLGTP